MKTTKQVFPIWFAALVLSATWSAAQDPSQRVLVNTNSAREEILFLDAKDNINNAVCLFPRSSATENRYRISSSSATALEDFHEAIDLISRNQQPAQIIFDGGEYDFSSDNYAIMNIFGCRDLRIIGNGSRLVMGSSRTGIRVANCNRVVISDLWIDYKHRVASFGSVELGPQGRKKVLLDAAYWDQFEDTDIYDSLTSIYQRRNTNPFHRQARHRWIGRQSEYSFAYDTATKSYIPDNQAALSKFNVGEKVTIKHREYGANAFEIFDSKNVCIQRCRATDVPGMFLFARKIQTGVLVRGNQVSTDPDDPLSVVGSSADGVHLDTVSKNIIIRNNQFSRLGDDAINLHSKYWHVVSVEQPNALVITYPYEIFEELPVDNDAILQILSPGLKLRYYARVTDVVDLGLKNTYLVYLDKSVEKILPADIVNVVTWQPKKFVILNNNFDDFWGRGMLIQARNGIIENNRIRNLTGCGISLTTDNFIFKESGSCQNITISNNLITNAAKSVLAQHRTKLSMGAISITSRLPMGQVDNPFGYSRNFLHSDILITQNNIRNCGGPGVFLASVRNTKLVNNSILDHSVVPYSRKLPGIDNGVTEAGYQSAILDFHSKDTTIDDALGD